MQDLVTGMRLALTGIVTVFVSLTALYLLIRIIELLVSSRTGATSEPVERPVGEKVAGAEEKEVAAIAAVVTCILGAGGVSEVRLRRKERVDTTEEDR